MRRRNKQIPNARIKKRSKKDKEERRRRRKLLLSTTVRSVSAYRKPLITTLSIDLTSNK